MARKYGAWKISKRSKFVVVKENDGEFIADCDSLYRGEEAGDFSNALLICAAPELFDALKTLYKFCKLIVNKDNPLDVSIMKKARKALKKAEGK